MGGRATDLERLAQDSRSFAGASEHRYTLEKKIASGGMATVHLGRAHGAFGFERTVAIKVCHPHLLDGEHRIDALVDEARVAARIRHPNVVATLDLVMHERSVMIVMEHVDGLTVAELVRASGRDRRRLPVDVVLRIVLDVLAGLHAAHELCDEHGQPFAIVHRDVSPQNVLVGVDGVAKLADFGVFKGRDRLVPSTETGELKGKLGYVAPEIYLGQPVTRRVDVYAMGVVLWEMLAGRRLFEEETHARMVYLALRGAVPPLASVRNDVSPELDAVLARALAVGPDDRYATAEDLAMAIERLPIVPASSRAVGTWVRAARPSPVADDRAASELTPTAHATPVRPKKRAARKIVPLSALAVVLVVAAASMVRVRSTPRPVTTRAQGPASGLIEAPAPKASAPAAVAPLIATAIAPSGVSSTAVAPRRDRPRRASPLPRASASATRSFYDPEEL